MIDASITIGHDLVNDPNDFQANSSAGPNPMNVIDGIRVNTGMTYLNKEVRVRPNLTILAETLIDQILFDGEKAVGIITSKGEKLYAKEVILSAGAIGSALILMRSGIGPKEELARHGIALKKDKPVGKTLRDHVFY